MYQVIIVVHVLLGIGVVGLVLMQQGKGADAGAAFGSGSSGSVFGAQGAASFLSRATAILATLFFTTSLGLAVLSGQQGKTTDLMSTPEAEDASGIPKVDGATDMKSVPAIPETGSEKAPAAPVAPAPATAPAEKPADQIKDKVEK
jgi:preprotein translocase subunit SecG